MKMCLASLLLNLFAHSISGYVCRLAVFNLQILLDVVHFYVLVGYIQEMCLQFCVFFGCFEN